MNHSSRDILEAAARDFVPDDLNLTPQVVAQAQKGIPSIMKLKMKLVTALVLILVALIVTLISLPGAVNAMKRLFGYIPGVGIVEEGMPIRVLKEPVSVTRDGVTVTVPKAILTSDKTSISYQVSGVPHSAYPDNEAVSGCINMEYLRLPDGTRLDMIGSGSLMPLPPDVNEATFVLPCIFNTLPGTVPEDWELPLQFVPAPPDLTVVPVTEILPSPSPSPQADTPAAAQNPLVITKVLEIGGSYVLMGELRYDLAKDGSLPVGAWWQVTNGVKISDASGQEIFYSYPNDIDVPPSSQPDTETWAYQVDKGFPPPLTITYSGSFIVPADPQIKVTFEFDAGPDPQPGQEWLLNRDFEMGGHTIRLVSITAGSHTNVPREGGYDFRFESDTGVSGVSVDIAGYTPNGGGGGGGGGPAASQWGVGLSYSEMPKGELTVVLSNLLLVGPSRTFQVQWSPDSSQAGLSMTPTPQPGVCLTGDGLSRLSPAPASLGGRALLYQLLEDGQTWANLVVNLDGGHRQVLEQGSSWPAFLPGGGRVSYDAPDALRILDVMTGKVSVLNGVGGGGYNLQWSPDGRQVAFVADGNDIFVSASDGTALRRLTNDADYKTLAGWSPDGSTLYITTDPGPDGWKLRAFDVASGESQDLFALPDSSFKAPDVTVSPDGRWLSYRDKNLNSLYVVRIDGTEGHMVVKRASQGISAGFWSADGQWLGVSLLDFDTNQNSVVLIQPGSCQVYLLPALHGLLEGLFMP
jgi:hypothetical protein